MTKPDTVRVEVVGRAASISPWLFCGGSFLLGAVATLGWSPAGQIWIAWSAFVVLVVQIACTDKPLQALLRCFCFALGLHAAGHGWVFSALNEQTQAGLLWSLLGAAFFLTYLAAFISLPAAGFKRRSNRPNDAESPAHRSNRFSLFQPVVLAVAWTAGEAMRGSLFNGFDSLAAGYLFSDWPLRGWVPVLGVYGCSLLFYTSSAVAGTAWACRSGSIRRPAAVGGVSVALVLAGGALLDESRWVEPVGTSLSFRLIQGGVAQQAKFDPRERGRQTASYTDAITAAPADLVVTPETAITVDLTELSPAALAQIRSFSAASGTNIFLGAPHRDASGGARNSVFHLAPGQSEISRYDKTRLMPLGEYAPWGFGWFTEHMSVALNDQTAGMVLQAPFQVRIKNESVAIGVLICHEDLSHQDARRWASQVGMFINPGNLAWFEGSLALPQRLQIARVRALETGRPLLRTTNTGFTAHIDEKGRVVSKLALDTAGTLAGTVQPTTGLTPFAVFGSLIAIGLASVMLLLAGALDWAMRCQRVSP